MNIETLKLLKQGLEDNFDRIQNHFDMKLYRSAETVAGCGLDGVKFRSKNDCGTHGCLLGNAPLLGIDELEPVASDYDGNGLDFGRYCRRVFNIKLMTHFWGYLFSDFWCEYDNTLQAAIDRLGNVISGEVTEDNAEEFLPWIYREL